MLLDTLRVGLLAVTLSVACVTDLRARRIPNALTFSALLLGLVLAGMFGGWPCLGLALGGVAVASLSLLLHAGRLLGAGDVKLLWAVGALTDPRFAGLTLLGTALAGGVLGLLWSWRRGGPRLPYALAITLGTVLAFGWEHGP